MKSLVLSLFYFSFVIIINAQQTATFTNDTGDGSWDNPQNWDTGEIPGSSTHAIIPDGFNVDGPDRPGYIVYGITNAGILDLKPHTTIQTQSLNNSGILFVSDNKITGGINPTCQVNNSGSINSTTGDISFENISTFSNIGAIDVENFTADKTNTFLNQDGGSINAKYYVDVFSKNFGNNGTMDAGSGQWIVSNYAYNNGVISSKDLDVTIFTKIDYLRNGGNGRIFSQIGKVSLNGKKGDFTGKVFTGYSSTNQENSNRRFPSEAVELAMDTSWVVGDTAKIYSQSIRFVFSYLSFIGLDSIKDIYADADIEFYGTVGATLDFEWNHAMNMVWSETGTIRIFCDYINEPDEELEYLFHPDPIVEPSDTTFTSSFISSRMVTDSTGNSGSFWIYIKNNSTGTRAFDYSISSMRNWVTSVSGTLQNLTPFQYDSLEVEYSVPINADTLTDEVLLTLSIGEEYADTAYSFIHSFPSSIVGLEETKPDKQENEIVSFPNPFSTSTTIEYKIKTPGNITLSIFNQLGEQVALVDEGMHQQGEFQFNFHPGKLPPGVYYCVFKTNYWNQTIKLIKLNN